MRSFPNSLIIVFSVLLLMGAACKSKTGKTDGILLLKEQVAKDSIALQTLQDQYQQRLQSDFFWCDSMLSFVNTEEIPAHFEILKLAHAYLTQFNDMLPVMSHDLSYLNEQLTHLQNDIDTHYINDSLAACYLADEKAVADTLHHRILYFQDRLAQQDKELQTLKKTIRKETPQ